ncbi:hypothetical protein FOXB_09662 [Fusarium oxysporum f. sp. conglutinans Fo5176]|uniref:SNF2 N-terminal domain-containing protein n=1 Tax=Fusarium oxysporum (strain Fo5176) TaxID=660025 RepID=F9FTE0_FUSOF|nr:hypothetical protein FOXB_09662 [Fusarium oxysporum f. sp. conglutinans Fo5176]KAI8415215.1 hypothetical protein FOFC_04835 [Fusarium oxysporum]
MFDLDNFTLSNYETSEYRSTINVDGQQVNVIGYLTSQDFNEYMDRFTDTKIKAKARWPLQTIPLEHQLIGKERLKMIANSTFRQGVPCDAVGLGKSSTSLLAALEIKEASHLIITEPFWAPGREEQVIERTHRLPQKREVHVCRVVSHPSMVDELVNDSRSSQLGQIHKDLYGVLIGKDDEAFDRELLSTRAAPEQEEEVKVELLDLEDANDGIMKRINAN